MKTRKAIFTPLGASNHSEYERADKDFYATDPKTVDMLLGKMSEYNEKFTNPIWECAAGNGHLSKELAKYFDVLSTDLIEREYKLYKEIDFLSITKKWNGSIITNPPYNIALEFIQKAINTIEEEKDGVKNKVAMFLKLTFLESKKRKVFFLDNPPKYVFVFSERIGVARNGEESFFNKSSAACYAWFVWEKNNKRKPIIDWI